MKETKTRKSKSSVNFSSEPFISGKNSIQKNKNVPFFKTVKEKETTLVNQKDTVFNNFPILNFGAQGEEVRYLQKRLNIHGANIIEDGLFGYNTHRAVRKFQAVHALPINGIVGTITWQTLASSCEKRNDKTVDSDYWSLAQSMYKIKVDLEQRVPTAKNIFGNLIQKTGNKFSKTSTKQAFIPTGTSNSPNRIMPLKTLLDILLKSIAIVDDFEESGKINSNKSLIFNNFMVIQTLVLHKISKNVKTHGLSQLSQTEVNLFLKRVHLMRDFYNSFLNNENFNLNPEIKTQNPIAGPHALARRNLVGLALSDVGKVRAHENPRFGWEHLKFIYDTAFNGKHPFKEHHFRNYSTTKQCAHGDNLCVKTKMKQHSKAFVSRDIIGSWCGIGAMYWLKIGGQSDLKWKLGVSGLANKLKHRPFNELPKVGDVLINSSFDHHGIITWIDPKAKVPKNKSEWAKISVKTIEANVQGGQIVHAPSGHEKLGYFDRGAFNSFERK